MAKEGLTRFVRVVKEKAVQMVTPTNEAGIGAGTSSPYVPLPKEKPVPQTIVPVPLMGTTTYIPPEEFKKKRVVVVALGKIGRRLGELKGEHVLTRVGDSITIDIKSKTVPQRLVIRLGEFYDKELVINLPIKK